MQRICVFCGSRPGDRPEFLKGARQLGRELALRGLGMVYGGAGVGLMGAIAQNVLESGGEAIGVIPEALVARELAHPSLTKLHVVRTMHERKALMNDLADGFIAMPGGFGTFEELFEVITWAQLGIHAKPIGLLNAAGYFDPLLALVERAVEDGFVPPSHRQLLIVAGDPGELLDRMLTYTPPDLGHKWATRAET